VPRPNTLGEEEPPAPREITECLTFLGSYLDHLCANNIIVPGAHQTQAWLQNHIQKLQSTDAAEPATPIAAHTAPIPQAATKAASGPNSLVAVNLLQPILDMPEHIYPRPEADFNILYADVPETFTTTAGTKTSKKEMIERLTTEMDKHRIGNFIISRLTQENQTIRKHAGATKAELTDQLTAQLRKQALATRKPSTMPPPKKLPPTPIVLQSIRTVTHLNPSIPSTRPTKQPKLSAPQRAPTNLPYGPSNCRELQAFELQNVFHPHDTAAYPDVLYLKTNHQDDSTKQSMIAAVRARKIAHNQRGLTDLSEAVCYGKAHAQPYPLEGAFVVYSTQYTDGTQLNTMYWCSKCATKGSSMRAGKRLSNDLWKVHEGIFKKK
jgi:hypothetical protein